jgi:hypothetical protein
MITDFNTKLAAFAMAVEEQTIQRLEEQKLDCEAIEKS